MSIEEKLKKLLKEMKEGKGEEEICHLVCIVSITISDEEYKIFNEICYDEGKTAAEMAERLLKTAIEKMAVENKDLIISTKEEVVVAVGNDGLLITKMVRIKH